MSEDFPGFVVTGVLAAGLITMTSLMMYEALRWRGGTWCARGGDTGVFCTRWRRRLSCM